MAQAVSYPSQNVPFYPIGNTSAVLLTETLTPEEPADLLLLGCGDPRNILFTVYNEADDGKQAKSSAFIRLTHWSVPSPEQIGFHLL